MIATAKEAHQVINEYRRVVASIKQGQDSLNSLKVEYNELERLARQIDQALATIPFTRWRLPKHPRAVKRMREYRRRADAFKEYLEVLRVNQDQAITRMDELVQSQDKMNDAVKQELKELLTKTI